MYLADLQCLNEKLKAIEILDFGVSGWCNGQNLGRRWDSFFEVIVGSFGRRLGFLRIGGGE